MTEDEKIAYFEDLERRSRTDKNAKMEVDIHCLNSAVEVLKANQTVIRMEHKDKADTLERLMARRFECMSKRIIALEHQIDGIMWVSVLAVAISIITVVAGIVGG